MILGAVLAGGQSRRFGSDKAEAMLQGRSLLSHALNALRQCCDDVIIIGGADRVGEGAPTIADWPRADMGPLGGIAGALRHAGGNGFDSALTCGVDSFALPDNLLALLSPAPAFLASQPVIGHWPVTAMAPLEKILQGRGSHSLRAFTAAIDATGVQIATQPANINSRDDLAKWERKWEPKREPKREQCHEL